MIQPTQHLKIRGCDILTKILGRIRNDKSYITLYNCYKQYNNDYSNRDYILLILLVLIILYSSLLFELIK